MMAGYKVNISISIAFFRTKNQLEYMMGKLPFAIATKVIKYL